LFGFVSRLIRLEGHNKYDQSHSGKGTFEMEANYSSSDLVEITADIVSAYVSNNAVAAADVPNLIDQTLTALSQAASKASQPHKAELDPAVPIKKSVTPDYIICLEDGKSFKSLKRHIRTSYNLTPEEYREKWGLPYDYPMVAPNYAEQRSALAKKIGLGRKRKL
jgi:predicted transcriptional regulator